MRIFVLTGAGISAESGLGTFRDKGGVWERFDPMKLATPEAFARDPHTVQAFYNARRRNLLEARPNEAHRALARLEAGLAARGGQLMLVNQNIDHLHERAGSRRVLHMHGELSQASCLACEAVSAWREDLGAGERCPACGEAGRLRPAPQCRVVRGDAAASAGDRGRSCRGRHVRGDRNVRLGVSGGGVRPAGAEERRADVRTQPRPVGQCRHVRRPAVWPCKHDRPSLG
jgi:hypothetical protein